MVLERAPASLRGELNRWMLEIRSGVFVGNLYSVSGLI
jgi:CRISPR-associated protein Cas2